MNHWRAGLAAFACVAAGCGGDDAGEDYPTNPGGGDSVQGGGDESTDDVVDPDADIVDGTATIAGRVCQITPLRLMFDLTKCADTGVGGLTVSLDGAEATTDADGAFRIAAPTDPAARWRVTGNQVITTVMAQGTSANLFVTDAVAYEASLAAFGAVPAEAGQGIVVVRVFQGTTPIEGATVVTDLQLLTSSTLYDAATPAWEPGLSGPAGLAWIYQTGVGDNVLSVTAPGSQTPVSFTVPVESQAITFQQIVLP